MDEKLDIWEAHVQCLDCDLSTGIACPYPREEAMEIAAKEWNDFAEGIARDKARIAELEAAIIRFIAAEQDMLDTFGVPCDNDAVEAEYVDALGELKKLVGE